MEKLTSSKLAVNGGKAVRGRPWSAGPYHFKAEIKALERVLAGPARQLGLGPEVLAFRELIKKTYKVKYVVTASSGTTAIHVALAAAGVTPGDEVIVSPLTDYGSIIGIFQLDAIPVFCDAIAGGLVIDPAKLEALITARTKVIMPVHNGGYCCDMPTIIKLAAKHKVKIIEDCAQAHLVEIGDQFAGCFGDFGCFSTNETKHMKTGEGGFILCQDKDEAEYAELFADKCYRRFAEAPPTPAFPALNVRMSAIVAALGSVQLKSLPGWIARRRKAGEQMEEVISRFPLEPHYRPANARCSYWWFAMYLDRGKSDIPVEEFLAAMQAEGVPCYNGGQPLVPGWEVFRKLNENPECFPTYRPGNLAKGMYSLDKWPQAQLARENIIIIPVDQHTGQGEIRDFERALDKIFASVKP